MKSFFILAFIAVCSIQLAYAVNSPITQAYKDHVMPHMEKASQFTTHAGQLFKQHGLDDWTLECGICTIAINEIEGFAAENISESYIEDKLKNGVCKSLGGAYVFLCDEFAQQLPEIIASLENKDGPGVICVDRGFCKQPILTGADLLTVPHYVLNLDLAPEQRWVQICNNTEFQRMTQDIVKVITNFMPDHGIQLLDIGRAINSIIDNVYAQEIRGCAAGLNVDYGWITILNLGYELSDFCTSIIATSPSGKVYHARNMDFWDGVFFTNTIKNMTMQVEFQKGGVAQFTTASFSGYVGVLSAMSDVFSITIDTRMYPQGVAQLFYEVIFALETQNASLVTFLAREAIEQATDFESAVNQLSNTKIIADVYYIMAGAQPGQGAVITRNRDNATDVWRLTSDRWFEVQTNYDHWKAPPIIDDRVVPANHSMNAIGQQDISLNAMLKVLSTKPMLNLQSVYTILASPADQSFTTYVRNCPYPCAE